MAKAFVIDARVGIEQATWRANYLRLLKQVRPDNGAYLLNVDGSTRLVGFGKLKLDEVKKLIGCDLVDVVSLPVGPSDSNVATERLAMIVDDEGLYTNDVLINPMATAIYNCLCAGQGTPICGNVVIASDEQF